MIRKGLIASFLVFALLFFAKTANAQYGCTGQYGQYGGCPPSQSIIINKLVAKPVTKGGVTDFVDNLSPSDPRFGPGSQVMFRLIVKNTSNTKLTGVTIKDFVPSYLDPLEGPGAFDSNTRTISFSAGDFNVNEEKTFDLTMQVADQKDLPADKGLLCVVNRAQAFNANASDDDTAQLCIEKQVMGVTQVPSSGPEFGLVVVAGEFALLGAGFMLRKKS